MDVRIEMMQALLNHSTVSKDALKNFIALIEGNYTNNTAEDDDAWQAYTNKLLGPANVTSEPSSQ